MQPVELQGQRLRLLPEKGLYWEDARTLIIADPHLGKAAHFRSAGLPVPHGTTQADLARLDLMWTQTRYQRLIILGDFLHAAGGRAPQTLDAIAAWIKSHPALDITLVRGNHDRHAGDPPADWGIRVVDQPWRVEPFVMCHEPPARPADGYVLAGHLHPALVLTDADGSTLRLPCFWLGSRTAVLPAMGSFTGAARIKPRPGDRVFVVGPGQVVEVPVGKNPASGIRNPE